MNDNDGIRREDYEEPQCPLIDPATGQPCRSESVPVRRVIEKLDEYCANKDFTGAERHLKYWLAEAREFRDRRGEFSVLNEMMGFYRKQGRKEDAVAHASAALELMDRIGYGETMSGATCYINVGTVYDNFGEAEQALPYFRKAQAILESLPHTDNGKAGGLYNNMGLALMDTGHHVQAIEYFKKAYELMENVEHGELEQAITLLNMADALSLDKGLEKAQPEIDACMVKAKELLDTPDLVRDGYYAFVSERCAPGFYCYGYSEFGDEIAERAEMVYKEIQNEGS